MSQRARNARRAIEEAIGTIAAPHVCQQILNDALSKASLSDVPVGPGLLMFAEGPLTEALEARLGESASYEVKTLLDPLLRVAAITPSLMPRKRSERADPPNEPILLRPTMPAPPDAELVDAIRGRRSSFQPKLQPKRSPPPDSGEHPGLASFGDTRLDSEEQTIPGGVLAPLLNQGLRPETKSEKPSAEQGEGHFDLAWDDVDLSDLAPAKVTHKPVASSDARKTAAAPQNAAPPPLPPALDESDWLEVPTSPQRAAVAESPKPVVTFDEVFSDDAPLILFISTDLTRGQAIAQASGGQLRQKPIADLVDLLDTINGSPDESPVIVHDTPRATVRIESIVALASDFPPGTVVLVWGPTAADQKVLDGASRVTTTWIILDASSSSKSVADACLQLVA